MADIANSGCLILWGYNPSYTRLTHATATVAALKRGMKLIVVDPRHVGLASKADLWLRPRPGTDGALALGLAHVMITRGWYDGDFVREWTNAPHLVRSDTGRLLRAADLAEGGEAGHLVAWDAAAKRPVAYDPRPAATACRPSASPWTGRWRWRRGRGWCPAARCSTTTPRSARATRPRPWRRPAGSPPGSSRRRRG